MKVRRDIRSIPVRSAAETWKQILDLITGSGTQHRDDLKAVGGIVASVITDEHPAQQPFILSGVGPRLVVYCSFRRDAMTGDDNVSSLNWNPTAGDWTLFVPCDAENLPWVSDALARQSKRVRAYDVAYPEKVLDADRGKAGSGILEIDWAGGGAQ